MLTAIFRNLMLVVATVVVVGFSAVVWPIDNLPPARKLDQAGAKLALALDETVVVGAALDGSEFGDEHVVLAAQIPTIQRLSLDESNVTKVGIRALQALPKLKYLNLARTRWSFEAIDDIVRLTGLRELSLEGCDWVEAEHIERIATLPNLESLNLSGTRVTATVYERLGQFPSLKNVQFNNCPQINDANVDSLIALRNKRPIRLGLSWTEITRQGLARLRASHPDLSVDVRPETMVGLRLPGERGQFITDAKEEVIGFRYRRYPDGYIAEPQSGDLEMVSSLSSITRLNLDGANVTNDLLMEAKPMPQLEALRLSSTLVSDAGLQVLERFPGLRLLLIANTDLEGPGLENLRHVPRLQTLQVQTRQGNEMLVHLANLHELQGLSIQAPLTDAGMEVIARLQSLKSLELIETAVQTPGIGYLDQSSHLEELILIGGTINDSDIEALSQMKSVSRIVLSNTKISNSGKRRIATLAPSKRIVWTATGAFTSSLPR